MSGAGTSTSLPPGQRLVLPRRGTTFVRDIPGPTPEAPVVMLLHGWTATADLNWLPSYGPLSGHFRVVAPDHRGHGQGIRSARPFRLAECADDAAAVADALGIDRFVAVGYSMGGPIATLVWRRHRHRVDGLVLCATAARLVPPDPRSRVLFGSLFGVSLAMQLAPPTVRRRAMARFASRRVGADPDAGWMAEEIHRHDPAALLQAGSAIGRFDSTSWLGEVDVPTAVVVTRNDQLVPAYRQRAMAAAIPGGRTIEISGRHSVCVERPSVFVPALIEACTDVSRRS